jgi:cytochrome c oxidase subunit II
MTAHDETGHDDGVAVSERIEKRWAILVTTIIAILVAVTIYTGLHWAMMPPSRVETIDPRTLHVAGEFIESNLGTATETDGSVTVRLLAQQYSFTPQCLLVPAHTPITFRATSADVVHGFLIDHTNINTMLVPGYVSTFSSTFDEPGEHAMPCHEFCGIGHQGMWAKVKVVEPAEFEKLKAGNGRASCVDQ